MLDVAIMFVVMAVESPVVITPLTKKLQEFVDASVVGPVKVTVVPVNDDVRKSG